jgi:tripartite-type tricarboxylate transporter receptor subunit TctC
MRRARFPISGRRASIAAKSARRRRSGQDVMKTDVLKTDVLKTDVLGRKTMLRTGFGISSWSRAAALMAIALGALIGGAAQAAWPDRPITIIVHFAPGGANDLLGRLIASELAPVLGQSVVVENRPGANGNIGLTTAARATPDGYTLVVASGVVLINPSIAKTGYDPITDFAPVAYLGASPNVLLTRPDSGIKTVADLIAKAKAEPGKVNYSSPGVGSISQLAVELLKLRAHVNIVHVPYQGAAPAAQAAASGTVDIASVAVAGMMGMVHGGTLTAIAQTGAEEWPELPGVPTMAQAGIPDTVVDTTQMLLAPAGTPQPVIDRLAKEVLAIMRKPEVRDKMMKASFAAHPEGPQELRSRIAREVPMWKDVVDKAGIKVTN